MATPELSPTELLVGFVLSTHMDRNGGSCWPSTKTLAHEAHASRRHVQRALRRLEALELLEVTATKGGRGNPNRYRIKGVTVSPFSGERATYTTQKGDTMSHEDVQEDVHNFSMRADARKKRKGRRAGSARPDNQPPKPKWTR